MVAIQMREVTAKHSDDRSSAYLGSAAHQNLHVDQLFLLHLASLRVVLEDGKRLRHYRRAPRPLHRHFSLLLEADEQVILAALENTVSHREWSSVRLNEGDILNAHKLQYRKSTSFRCSGGSC